MKIVERWQKAKQAISRFRDNNKKGKRDWKSRKHKKRYQRLLALGKRPDPAEVSAILGSIPATLLICRCCMKPVERVAVLWDDDTATICPKCIGLLDKLLNPPADADVYYPHFDAGKAAG